jgi:hypothetical protein
LLPLRDPHPRSIYDALLEQNATALSVRTSIAADVVVDHERLVKDMELAL